jgi:hypothetical protein
VRRTAVTISRRTLLGCAGLVLVGCRGGSASPGRSAASPGPDAAALTAARQGELALLLSYDTAILRASAHQRPALQVARALHATHLTALGGSPPPSTRRGPRIHDLPSALSASARTLQGLAVAAHDGHNAATLASIAASHAATGR